MLNEMPVWLSGILGALAIWGGIICLQMKKMRMTGILMLVAAFFLVSYTVVTVILGYTG